MTGPITAEDWLASRDTWIRLDFHSVMEAAQGAADFLNARLAARIPDTATVERQRIIDDLVGVYDRRVAGRKGARPNKSDDFLAAVIQRVAGIDPMRAALSSATSARGE